jgi:hypothetical protein
VAAVTAVTSHIDAVSVVAVGIVDLDIVNVNAGEVRNVQP